jgi:uncharacterized membrane protein
MGRASVPIDLMSYRPEDKQPSVFLLKEDARQWILTVFNWTDVRSSRAIALNDLGLKLGTNWTATDVLRGGAAAIENGAVAIMLPPQSVRMIKLVDNSVPEAVPAFTVQAPGSGHAGVHVEFHAVAASGDAPVLAYHWDFGDGVSAEDANPTHAFMQAGQYTVTVTATGLNSITAKRTLGITVTGTVPTSYNKAAKERYEEPKHGAGP